MDTLNKTIEQLEKNKWGEPKFQSHVVVTSYKLRKKKLKDFTIEDLRLMIGQNIGNQFLIPLAINHLEQDINSEGDFYPGDLLKSVLTSETSYWRNNQNLKEEVVKVIDSQLETLIDREDFEDEINFFKKIKNAR